MANPIALHFGSDAGTNVHLHTAEETLTLTGASTTSANAFPDGCIPLGVSTYVTTAVTYGGGGASYAIGDGTDVDMFGIAIAGAVGDSTDNSDWTASPNHVLTAATNVVFTPNAGTFSAGAVHIIITYLTVDGVSS